MNIRKILGVSVSSTLIGVLLFYFQNCESVSPSAEETDSSSIVRIVDDFNDQKVSFIQNLTEIHHSASSTYVDGFCQRKDHEESFQWELLNAGDQSLVARGTTACERGGFRIQLDGLQSLECGEDYRVYLTADSGESAITFLKRKCEPLETLQSNTSGCFYETEVNIKTGDTLLCMHVCYKNLKVQSRQQVEARYCPEFTVSL